MSTSRPEPTEPTVDVGPVERLRATWIRRVDGRTDLFDRLVVRHREDHRRYHTIGHVDAVVGWIDDLAGDEVVDDLGAVVAAGLYHDAIYEPESTANERASARLAVRDLSSLGWSHDRRERVWSMIEGTADHLDPVDTDSAVLFDADLAILGAEPAVYESYVASVRAEYRHVSDDDWKVGRAAVLRSFLERPTIFATETGRRRWESAARSNLSIEIDALGR